MFSVPFRDCLTDDDEALKWDFLLSNIFRKLSFSSSDDVDVADVSRAVFLRIENTGSNEIKSWKVVGLVVGASPRFT